MIKPVVRDENTSSPRKFQEWGKDYESEGG